MSSTALSSTFELPPDDRTYTWMRDGLHVPRPLPRLVGHAMQRWFQESMGNRWQLVNGYAYMGFAGSGPAFSVEPAPQADAGAAWRESYLPRVVAIVERRLAMDYSGLDPAAMLAGFDDAIRDAAVAFAYTMAPIGPLSGPMAELMGFCAAKFGADGELRALTMLQGYDNVTSATGAGLHQLAVLAEGFPAVAKALLETRGSDIQGLDGGPEFLAALDRYIHVYGRGNQTWFEFHRPSWAEDPSVPLAMIGGMLRQQPGHRVDPHVRSKAVAAEALNDALAELTSETDRAKLSRLVDGAADYVSVIEERALWQLAAGHTLRLPPLAIGAALAVLGRIPAADDVFHLDRAELTQLFEGPVSSIEGQLAERRAEIEHWGTLAAPQFLGAPPPPGMEQMPMLSKMFGVGGVASTEPGFVKGSGASRGVVRGIARVILDLDDADRLAEGEILVCPFTAPPWTPLFGLAAAVVTDAGGVLSHAAIAAREYAIPAVVGTKNGTTALRDGALVEVDGAAGTVRVVG